MSKSSLRLALAVLLITPFFASAQIATASSITPNTLAIGNRVKTTANLNVRSKPTTGPTGKKLCTQPTGALGTIVGGPQRANGYTWWNVNYNTSCSGWSVQTYLALVPTGVSVSAQVWQVAEVTFTSTATYTDPFTDVNVDAIFTGPNGVVIKRPAFWDGGSTWKVRFAPTQAGTWTFTTTATNTSDAGLNNITGTVVATPYTGNLPLYQHGFIKSQVGHYLLYQDGTPFWWMGNDMTLIDLGIDYGGFTSSNKTSWNPPVAHPNSQILGSIDRWASQKFNVIAFSFFQHWMPNTPPGTMPDTARFDTYYDPVMAYAASQGMSFKFQLGTNSNMSDGVTAYEAYARYLIARYGAYSLVWTVDEPDAPDATQYVQNWGTVLGYTASLDGYHHPIGPWYRQTALGQTPTLYLDTSWANIIIFQCGHLKAPSDYSLGGQQLLSGYQFYYDNYPNIPMVEAGGCNYDSIFPDVTDYISRRSAWRASLAGSSGFGFGENGMWNMQWDATVPNGGGEGQVTPWYVGIDDAAGAQMQYLKNFMASLPWQSMRPLNLSNSVVTWSQNGLTDISTPVVSGDSGLKNVVVYFPQEFIGSGSSGTISGLSPFIYNAEWYNPTNGALTPISNSIAPGIGGTWTMPQKPDNDDWALLLQATSQPSPFPLPATFSASPTSGAAPLSVSFAYSNPTAGVSYTINFGDGTSGSLSYQPVSCSVATPNCQFYSATHTYTTAGTYTVVLSPACSGTACAAVVLGSVTVTVTQSTNGNLSAIPTSGNAPLTVTFSGVGQSISFGDGATQGTSNGPMIGQTTHAYQNPGSYTATSGNSLVSITVTNSAPPTFSATPTSGQAPLVVAFQTMVPQGNTSTYSVTFGDGTTGQMSIRPSGIACTATGPCYTGIATISHTYTTAGTYTAKLTDSSGNSVGITTITSTP